jgi:CRISPR/Cas system CSM-associated protein Csm3 (group 7 of RAMP superfamily)
MKLELEYTLVSASGVLIGSTAEILGLGIDKTTVRRSVQGGLREPIIPGSTMKGKIRDSCERILLSLGKEVCLAPRADTMCPHNRSVRQPPCPVCRLFGGPSDRSRIIFSDAIADTSRFDPRFASVIQAGVSLSRARRTAEDDRLFYIERAVEGLHYRGTISGRLEADAVREVALLMAAIERLIALGGSKSRGAGWTDPRVTKVTLDDRDSTEDRLREIRSKGISAWSESK